MSEATEEFLDAYDEHRVVDQTGFYSDTASEYEHTARQIGLLNGSLLFIAAACGAAGAIWTEQAVWLGLVAAGLAAVAGAVTSWGDVVGFSANAELYRATETSLIHLRPTRPPDAGAASADDVASYVHAVEDVLTGEVRVWGETWAKAIEDAEGHPDDDD